MISTKKIIGLSILFMLVLFGVLSVIILLVRKTSKIPHYIPPDDAFPILSHQNNDAMLNQLEIPSWFPFIDLSHHQFVSFIPPNEDYQIFTDQLNRYHYIPILKFNLTEPIPYKIPQTTNTTIIIAVSETSLLQLFDIPSNVKQNKVTNYINHKHLRPMYKELLQNDVKFIFYYYESISQAQLQSQPQSNTIIHKLQQIFTTTNTIYIQSNTTNIGQSHAAQSIFSGLTLQNVQSNIIIPKTRIEYMAEKLPIFSTKTLPNFNYTQLETNLDALMYEAIYTKRSTPSGVIMAIKDGLVLFEKAYGYQTYLHHEKQVVVPETDLNSTKIHQHDTPNPEPFVPIPDINEYIAQQDKNCIKTKLSDIYDLASVTKIVSTTPIMMQLVDQNIVQLHDTLGQYLDITKNTNKESIQLRTLLLHEAGLTPTIKWLWQCWYNQEFSHYKLDTHQDEVAYNCWILTDYYYKQMLPDMIASELEEEFIGKYMYSDLSMYFLKEVITEIEHVPFHEYVRNILFKPLGMSYTSYKPIDVFNVTDIYGNKHDKNNHNNNYINNIMSSNINDISSQSQSIQDPSQHDIFLPPASIIPTVNADFRKSLIVGFPHDEGAAMGGGVAGHAGLFGNANDLAIYSQLLLNRGSYGNIRFFSNETVDLFTHRVSNSSRRGLGFDRWDPDRRTKYPSPLANASVYGHTGFTGVCLWIDPYNQLTFIFLTNRVHPDRSTRFLENKYREKVFDIIYNSIGIETEPII